MVSFLTVEKKQERNFGETMKMFAMGFLHGNYTRLTQKNSERTAGPLAERERCNIEPFYSKLALF